MNRAGGVAAQQVLASRRHALVIELVESQTIRSAWVKAAFDAVPREVFVPRFYRWMDGEHVLVDRDDRDRHGEWLSGVYSDQVLTVQMTAAVDVVDPAGVPTSSSSMPTVMAGMLEALDLHPGHRVLEIGTGTGYNTALLTHRVGDGNVTSVELDPQLADAARAALAEIRLYPTVHAGDGALGVPEAAPFDRIIATAAIDHIPLAWIDQLAPGGVIVADLRGSLAGGIVRLDLRRDDGRDDGEVVTGRFAELPGAFMPMRVRSDSPYREGERWDRLVLDQRNPHVGRTKLDPAVLADPSFRFLLQLHLAGHRLRGFVPDASGVSGHAADGSWVAVNGASEGVERGEHVVRQGGPQRLWDTVETAHATWQRLDQPPPSRFEVVADAYTQQVRYADGDAEWSWPLPM